MVDAKELLARQWVDARESEVLFPVKPAWLLAQSRKGYIRSAKLGPSQQARRVFFVPDIQRVLETLSEAELVASRKGTE